MAQHLEVVHLPIGWKYGEPIAITVEGQLVLSPAMVKMLLGGKWPKFHGFNFNAVSSWLFENGELIPLDELGEEAPGPNLKLKLSITKAERDAFYS